MKAFRRTWEEGNDGKTWHCEDWMITLVHGTNHVPYDTPLFTLFYIGMDGTEHKVYTFGAFETATTVAALLDELDVGGLSPRYRYLYDEAVRQV